MSLAARQSPLCIPRSNGLEGTTYAALLETIDQSVIFTDMDGWIQFWNSEASRIFGYSADEMLGKSPAVLYPEEDPGRFAADLERILAGEDFVGEWRGRRRDGGPVRVDIRTTVVRDPAGTPLGFLGISREVTPDGSRTEPMRLKQGVLEAVARLAGGVAHESNNQMTVVLGETSLLLRRADLPGSIREDLARIQRAAQRITEISRQLLAFSRRQMLQPFVLDLNAAITKFMPELQRSLGSGIELRLALSPEVPAVRVDEAQLEQVLGSLAFNARDAMPGGGSIELVTGAVVLPDPTFAIGGVSVAPGGYAELLVRDSGAGMDPDTLAHVFEPFFTTKGPGQGTGLGLASVYGIVKQSGGYVFADSSPGHGAQFRILLPAADQT
jgi:two-component system, cell cycle sensor histidine kinase and response regulator CckA